jgi:hypothetical protein
LAADYLPLKPGNGWVYRDASTGQTFTVRVGAQLFANQHVYHALFDYAGDKSFVRVNGSGNLVALDEETGQEVLITAFGAVSSGWFEAQRRMCPQHGQAQEKPGVHDGPTGDWSVLEIRYRPYACADAGDELEQFADNIGMVRRVVHTIAGPRTFDLVYARLGNQWITTDGAGAFTISAVPGLQSGTWLATMRVSIPVGPAMLLTYPSGQMYDLRLRDLDGKIVWTWSADKLFVAQEQQNYLAPNWSASEVIPFPLGVPETTRTYILEAWLTVAENQPQFAAATFVEVPGIEPARERSGRGR